jgi:hypothetical protein
VRRGLVVSIAVIGLSVPFLAESQEVPRRLGGQNGPMAAEVDTRPAPRLADGKIDLSGVWTDGGGTEIPRLLKPGELDSILLPKTKQLMESRNDGQDPYNYCLPGGPVRITGGFAWRLIQHPTTNSTHIFMLQEGNAHTYRQIFMDGRKHPEDPSSLSTRSDSMTSSGSTGAAFSTQSSCTWWSGTPAPTSRRFAVT